MLNKKNISEKGSILPSILLIITLLIIIGLVYFLLKGEGPTTTKTTAIESPDQQTNNRYEFEQYEGFDDGLRNPSYSEKYQLDELGEGIASKDIFNIDINSDGLNDRITKTKHENATSHSYYEYKIELNKNGNFIDITPDGFRTTEGADCALQKIRFVFKPKFEIIKISRKWQDSWETPTMATKTTYNIKNDSITQTNKQTLQKICDVAELF